MDRTVLTLAIDSSQVGTAAAAFDRMVNAGNAAASSAGRVTSATLLEGRTIQQTLIPALTNSINRTRTLDEAQAELGRDASRQFGQNMAAMRSRAESAGANIRDAVTNIRASSEQTLPRVAQAVSPAPAARVVSTAAPALVQPNINGITQLASAAASARLAIDRQTEAVNASRGAFVQLTQAAESTARSYHQQNQTPVSTPAAQSPSTAAATLATAPQANPNAMREVAQAMSATATQATRVTSAVTEANRAIAATPRITAAASAVPAPRAPLAVQSITSASTGQPVPTATGTPVAQLASDAGRAQTTVERLTAAARNQRSALAELAPAAASAAVSYRQIAATPIRLDAPQGISATAAALVNVATQAENARRSIAGLNQGAAVRQPTAPTAAATSGAASAPNTASMNALAAATAHSTTATNAFAASQGRAAEAAQHLAEANARNQSAQAQLAVAIQRAAAAQAAFDAASRSGSTNTDGITAAQTRLQSAQAAVSVATANVARSQRAAAEAAERHRVALAATGHQSQLTSFQTQQLHFQLHDFFVQVISGQSPLTAFIQQGSQLSGTFNGAGGAFRAVMSLITPMRVLFAGTAGAVAALGYAFYEGARQSKAFNDAVTMTGNFAGQTAGQFTALTREIASHGEVTASAAREAAQAALSSGQVGPKVFAKATEAIALYAQATDQTAADVAKDFAEMAKSPSKWAEEHNRTLHFITAAQYDAIKAFEDSGKSADAQGVIYNALTDRMHKLSDNLGYLEKVLRNGKSIWSQFWDAAYDVGRPETIEQKIAKIDAKIQASRRDNNPFAPAPKSRTAQLAKENSGDSNLEYELQDELAGQARQQAVAANEATKAEEAQAGITAKAVIDGYLKRGKAASAYKEALDKLNKSFKDSEVAGTPVSDADKKVALTQLKKDFTPAKDNEASQVLRAQLQNDIKAIQDVLQAERDALTFQQNYLQNVYQRGGVSLTDYYDQKRKAIAEGVAAELDELDKEKARLEQYLGQTKDPSEKVQTRTRINEIDAEKSKIELRASRDTVLTNEEESASYKALSEQVINYRANLLQMQGDEAGAAALRAQTVIANAKVLAAQADKLPGAPRIDVEELTRAIQITDRFNEVQRQTSLLASTSSRAEEAFLLAAEQSGKSLMETERGLYELRANELAQLGALAAKARELADASTDPKVKAFAADLALSYAKAANAIDPALNRLRDANRELAAGLSQTIGNAPNAFTEFYSQRRTQSEQDIRSQKDEYSKRIDTLRGYLAQEKDERNKAALNKRIDQLQGESDGLKVESKGKTAIDALRKTVLDPAAQQVSGVLSKVLIQDPLQAYFKDKLTKLTEGDGPLASFFKDALGIKADPKQLAEQQQAASIQASTSAIDALRVAAENAANALNKPLSGVRTQEEQALTSSGAQSGVDSTQPAPVDSELAGVQSDAAQSLQIFDKQTITTASDVLKLANAAGDGGNAMVRLPGIVGMFQSAVTAMQASGSSGGGIGGFIASLFGGSSGGSSSYEAAVASTGIFHSGGVVGQPPATRNVSASLFAGAPRYHTGGIVGKAADKGSDALKHNEVPAILMGGPKGKREEVLTADDPRHRDNLGMDIVARIREESKFPLFAKRESSKFQLFQPSSGSNFPLFQKHETSKFPLFEKHEPSRSPLFQASGAAKFSLLPGLGASMPYSGRDYAGPHSGISSLFRFASEARGQMESSANVLGSLFDRFGVGKGSTPEPLSGVRPRGARELGGPVSAGGMYRVNERGPELLEVAGKQYLMMGGQGGKIEPNSSKGEGRVINQTINFHSNGPVTRQTQQQLAAAAYRGSARASSRND